MFKREIESASTFHVSRNTKVQLSAVRLRSDSRAEETLRRSVGGRAGGVPVTSDARDYCDDTGHWHMILWALLLLKARSYTEESMDLGAL